MRNYILLIVFAGLAFVTVLTSVQRRTTTEGEQFRLDLGSPPSAWEILGVVPLFFDLWTGCLEGGASVFYV